MSRGSASAFLYFIHPNHRPDIGNGQWAQCSTCQVSILNISSQNPCGKDNYYSSYSISQWHTFIFIFWHTLLIQAFSGVLCEQMHILIISLCLWKPSIIGRNGVKQVFISQITHVSHNTTITEATKPQNTIQPQL